MPVLDVWINVADNELQYVSNIIPTLDWDGGFLGVRFIYVPRDIVTLYFHHWYQKIPFAHL